MSHQRRRKGQVAKVFRTIEKIDRRGNKVLVEDNENPATVRAVFIPDRSSRAEVAGQQEINVYRMLVDPDTEGVNLWSRIEWNGKTWDVVTPAAYHNGTKHTRHISVSIRQRPS